MKPPLSKSQIYYTCLKKVIGKVKFLLVKAALCLKKKLRDCSRDSISTVMDTC
jgi:hypothetical protein